MSIHRYLKGDRIKLELETAMPVLEEGEEMTDRRREAVKESVLGELADLLDRSGKVGNKSKLLTDLMNRERKATTGIGRGIAIPHVRTIQAKEMVMALARSTKGLDFMALDDEPVHVFLAMVAPPYDDKTYLRIYQEIGQLFSERDILAELLAAESEHEIIRILQLHTQ